MLLPDIGCLKQQQQQQRSCDRGGAAACAACRAQRLCEQPCSRRDDSKSGEQNAAKH